MRYLTPDTPDSSAGNASGRDSGSIPSGMDNDPHADEEVINQQANGPSPREQYPKPVEEPAQPGNPSKITPANLADSIAYALDGSGPGPTNDTPNVSGHKVITEGITGASLDDEEDAV